MWHHSDWCQITLASNWVLNRSWLRVITCTIMCMCFCVCVVGVDWGVTQREICRTLICGSQLSVEVLTPSLPCCRPDMTAVFTSHHKGFFCCCSLFHLWRAFFQSLQLHRSEIAVSMHTEKCHCAFNNPHRLANLPATCQNLGFMSQQQHSLTSFHSFPHSSDLSYACTSSLICPCVHSLLNVVLSELH